jgi:Zn ribbon nucleic-acid-binding protein
MLPSSNTLKKLSSRHEIASTPIDCASSESTSYAALGPFEGSASSHPSSCRGYARRQGFRGRRFAQFFSGTRRSSLIPRAFPDCMPVGILAVGGAVERRSVVVKEQRFIRPIRCAKCGGNAHLTRRSPDQVKRDGSEIRVFECYECGHQTHRSVKS